MVTHVAAPAETAEQEWKAWCALVMTGTAPSHPDRGGVP